MRYRGKPSSGCATCRKRKIKCDLREGGCQNCEKAGWQCEGYRDVNTLMFLDQTASTAQKVNSPKHKNRRSSAPTDNESMASERTMEANVSRPPLILPKPGRGTPQVPVSLLPTLEELSLGFFFNNYVREQRNRSEQWSVDMWSGCLLASIKALGAAGVTGSTASHREANKHYSHALQLTNKALSNPETAKQDSTLMAVLVLSIVETVSGSHKSLEGWRQHVNGAASLLHLRGLEQFYTPTGCRLALQTCCSLIASCLNHRLPISRAIWDIMQKAQRHMPSMDSTIWRYLCAGMRTADLHATLSPGNIPKSTQHAAEVLIQACSILTEYDAFLADAPAKWHPRTIIHSNAPSTTTPPTELAAVCFSTYYYIFESSHVTAESFVGALNCKLLLLDMIQKSLPLASTPPDTIPSSAPAPLLTPAHLLTAHTALRSLPSTIQDILATVPQHLLRSLQTADWMSPGKDGLWQEFAQPLSGLSSSNINIPSSSSSSHRPLSSRPAPPSDHLPYIRTEGGYHIQFALFNAGMMSGAGITATAAATGYGNNNNDNSNNDIDSTRIRSFAIMALKQLREKFGASPAGLLAEMLEGQAGEGRGG